MQASTPIAACRERPRSLAVSEDSRVPPGAGITEPLFGRSLASPATFWRLPATRARISSDSSAKGRPAGGIGSFCAAARFVAERPNY